LTIFDRETVMQNAKPASALSDLVLSSYPDPNNSNQNIVVVTNNSTSDQIKASVTISSDKSFDLYDLSYTQTRSLFPYDFQVTIPAGLTRFVSYNKFGHILQYPTADGGAIIDTITVTPNLVAATYDNGGGDEPPKGDEIYDYVFRYYATLPGDASVAELFINIGHVFGTRFSIISRRPPYIGTDSSIDPFTQKILNAGDKGVDWEAYNITWYQDNYAGAQFKLPIRAKK
jgi:hypothetical protein